VSRKKWCHGGQNTFFRSRHKCGLEFNLCFKFWTGHHIKQSENFRRLIAYLNSDYLCILAPSFWSLVTINSFIMFHYTVTFAFTEKILILNDRRARKYLQNFHFYAHCSIKALTNFSILKMNYSFYFAMAALHVFFSPLDLLLLLVLFTFKVLIFCLFEYYLSCSM